MKRTTTAAILLAALALSGCASLNVSWSFTASYNTGLMQQTGAVHKPAAAASTP
jgi:hypothetical protein